jgi:hypothetical protein
MEIRVTGTSGAKRSVPIEPGGHQMHHVSRERRGSGMTEYVILIALIGIATILALMSFDTEVIHQYGGVATPRIENMGNE